MSSFLLTEVSPEHHRRCQDECGKTQGSMLKCMNLAAIGQNPCNNVIHVECAGYDPRFVPLMSNYYCTDCTTSNESLHQQMNEIEAKAKQEFRNLNAQSESVSRQEYERLKIIAEKLDRQLQDKINKITTTVAENKKLAATVQGQQSTIEKQSQELKRLSDAVSRLESASDRSLSVPSAPAAASGNPSSTFIDRFNDTLLRAEGVDDQLRNRRQTHLRDMGKIHMSSISNSTFSTSRTVTGWPDYDEHSKAANKLSENSLMLVRASLAKPLPFDGDVTKWATFLSEFVRTSERGHYRDFEDIDRLRELIIGEAREMFTTELTDPCAEAIPTLIRLDEFFGVKGNAVRVALDRITQLPRIDKAGDKQRLKTLYTLSKQFALQCRIHQQENELTSESILYILEMKMHTDHVKNWRPWTKTNSKPESVDGVIAYIEEIIRDLSFKSTKSKPNLTATVNTADVTGGLENGGTDTSTAPHTTSAGSSKSQDKSRKKGSTGNKRKNRYANCECFLCKEKHPFYKCPQLIEANDKKRNEIVNRLHVCMRCLCSNKHKIEDCHNKCMRCYVSGCNVKNRHPLLHGHSNDQLPSLTSTNAHIDVNFLQVASHFAVVPGHVIASDGNQIPITIMYDGGSGVSLATAELYNQGKYECYMEYELTLRWATDITHTDNSAKLFDIKFLPYGKQKPITLSKITAVTDLKLPEQGQDPKAFKGVYPHLANVPIPSYSRQAPQILLGLSHARLISPLTSVTSEKDSDPVAALTPLGWVVYGNCHDSLRSRAVSEPKIVGFTCSNCSSNDISNEELLRYIRSCNDVESIGVAHSDASLLSADDQRAEKLIKTTMKYMPQNQRYEIGLLWRNENCIMPDNYQEAVQRLMSTEKRLIKLDMLTFVQEQFKEQIENGWLVETSREEADKYPRRNYVYGFLTFNKNKTPPKPRWVNDTAAKFRGVSLNSELLKGPDSLVPLPQSMCALREGQIAFQGDVKSMFNQVLLKFEDQFSQLTLWRDGNNSQDPRIYRQTRVIFGPTCSPSVTSAVRIHHAQQCMLEYPEAADVAIHQMYVDDAPDSRDTIEESAKVANDLITMFSRIGWPLVQFQSNSQEMLRLLPPANVNTKMVEIGSDSDEYITKVLGIFWKPQQDVYIYRLNDDSIIKKCTQQNYLPTKKEMLSTVMRIFDPIGLIAPFRIRGHMIMQHVWRAGTDWRKKPPKEICEEFSKWLQDFEIVAKLEIPRPYSPVSLKASKLTLHVFVDAGAEAYATCVYLHVEHADQIYVRLIAAKSRVAPLKYMSIPRLELMSGLLGARLLKSVMQWHRRLKINDYICWTDSDVSYKWIRSHHLPRTAFSAPRIAEIQELTSADKWRYVPSKLNVADYATKERQMDYSDPTHEWFTGPKFLYEPPDNWPKAPVRKEPEVSVEANLAFADVSKRDKDDIGILAHVSSKIRADWSTFTRVIAKALRFADYLLPHQPYHRRKGHLTAFEIERAENYIIRIVQLATFSEEYRSLLTHKKLKKSSQLYSLSPYLCPKTLLIRATTRLSCRFSLNMRAPPILPNFHEVTDTIVNYYHRLNLHVGDSAITAQIRSRVWIINAKRAVRRCRARCLHCIEKRTKPGAPNMADLPDFRLDINEKPFFHTGCDLFGPFTTYIGRSRRKTDVHIVIFTCMVTRAVYFEILDDKSTANFLVAFDKLWTRRGPISHMYSDNGLNFVGASRVIDSDELQKATADKRITWHFNPAYTPQFGGAWERLIKDVKRSMEASLGKFIVPRLSMESALARIEANLNNRPLTHIPVASVDDIPLTPYLLMTGYPNYPGMDDCSSADITNAKDVMNIKPARRINALVQAFRHRFITEYAPIITRRPVNSAKDKYLLKLNDYVIYLDPTKNPSEWPRGIVSKIYPGKDEKVRVADIKLKKGSVLERRPAHLIAKLDIRFEDQEAETQKYHQQLNLLVNSNLNLLSQKSGQHRKHDSEKMSKHIYCRVFDDSTTVSPTTLDRSNKIDLTKLQRLEYIDKSGESIVYMKNLPPNLGASEIFTIMCEFGDIKMIASTKWNGVQPFNCFVGFSDPASVGTAVSLSESQIITVNGVAYKQKFERLRKPFNPVKFFHKPIYAFLDIALPLDVKQRVLFITSGETDKICARTSMPPIGYTGGFINCCPRTHRYEFDQLPVDISNGAAPVRRLPYVLKNNTQTIATSSHSSRQIITANRSSQARKIIAENGQISIRLGSQDPFDGPQDYSPARKPDLRQLIDKKKEVKRLRSVICRPYRTRKSQINGHSPGGTM